MVVLALCAALAAGCEAEPVPQRDVPTAPYAYVGAKTARLSTAVAETPARRFVLSFLLARQARCEPAWNGRTAVQDAAVLREVQAVQAAGGAVTIASGGADGTYLETVCSSAATLAEAYRTAMTVTGADRLDVDIEAAVPAERVAEALRLLHHRTGAGVTVTLGVAGARRGLEPSALPLLHALAKRDLDVVVNAMVMNFPAQGNWRKALVTAAETVTDQIQRVWPEQGRAGAYRRLGLTFMAGRNDTGPVTTLDDARALRHYARARGIGFLGFWSLGRDNGSCPGHPVAADHCSGLGQPRYAFTRLLSQTEY